MTDHGVLLKGPLVRQFLAGQKTVTRRTDLKKWRRAKPGDRIWFRETFFADPHKEPWRVPDDIAYRADFEDGCSPYRLRSHGGWRPSLFMPKWAARCWAEIEDIREESLWDITEEDARLEGVESPVTCDIDDTARKSFAALWNSINGKKPGLAWADNPVVARIQFRKIEVPR